MAQVCHLVVNRYTILLSRREFLPPSGTNVKRCSCRSVPFEHVFGGLIHVVFHSCTRQVGRFDLSLLFCDNIHGLFHI